MSYADTLPLLAEQERQELRAIERERKRMRAQFVMCDESRKTMLEDFYTRVRLGHAAGQNR